MRYWKVLYSGKSRVHNEPVEGSILVRSASEFNAKEKAYEALLLGVQHLVIKSAVFANEAVA